MNISRSLTIPSSNGRSTAFLTDSIAFSQASKPRNFLAFALRMASKISGWPRAGSSLSERSRTLRSGAFSAISRRAKASADFAQFPFLGEFVDDAPFLGLARAERRAGEDDVERLLNPDQPRQALRAAGAGNEAELDFRQAAFRRRDGDAVVRRQRDLESAAERRSVQRGDDRLRRVLDPVEHVGKVGRGGRLAEFGNVGAGDEGPPAADDHDGLDRAVRFRRLDAAFEAVADGLRQRVHRRGVDRDQRDLAVDGEVGDGIDGGHGVFPPAWVRRMPSDNQFDASRCRRYV